MTTEVKWRLSETYILSQFNYGDIILQGLNNDLIQKIQKVQNSCIRYSHGLRNIIILVTLENRIKLYVCKIVHFFMGYLSCLK